MARNLKIRDLTLRDGQQSSFATRMNQEQIDRCLPFYKDANFYAMEVWGGAVPDSVMRYLNENPWTRLETIYKAVGDVSKLTALSRGRNLFGYSPYTDEIIDGFCRNSIRSGLGIMRIFDALNDVDNVKSTVKYVKQYGGIADCAVCYTVDPKYPEPGFWARLTGKSAPKPVFTDAYFLDKARQMAALGADMITIKDMSGLIPPRRVATLVRLLKKNLSVPVDFHTHCTPGYGLASVLSAIIAGVDVVDTNCWYFAEGTGAPAIELIHVFCKKLGIETGVNMEAVAKINTQLRDIRKELNQSVFGVEKPEPKAFNPVTDTLPAEIDALFDRAIAAAQHDDENATIDACRKIEAYFGFPAPNELVQKAEIPGGMYSNMVAQLKQLKAEDIHGEVVAAFNIIEETTVKGIAAATNKYPCEYGLFLDTIPCGDVPDVDFGKELPVALKKGPVLLHSQLFMGLGLRAGSHPKLVEAVRNAAEKTGANHQEFAFNGAGYVTDAVGAVLTGMAVVSLALPRRYSHSPVELFHMNDICDTQKTVEEFLKNEVDLGLLHK